MDQVFVKGFFGLIFVIFLGIVSNGIHVIHEGHIGIYTRGGALLQGISEPGLNFLTPFITRLNQIQTTIQTDQVQDIPCGTSSGVLIYFDKIEVVNRLKKEHAWQTIKNYTINYDQTWIFSKIHHEINQFCSKHTLHEVFIDKFDQLDESLQEALQSGCDKYAPGIEIISVRVTKPKIPKEIQKDYIQTEAEKTQLLIAREQQKISQEESEIRKTIQQMEAELESQVQQIKSESLLLDQQGKKQISQLEDQMVLEKQKVEAESEFYRSSKQIQINNKKLKTNFMDYEIAKKIKDINKKFFGSNIKDYLQANNLLTNNKQQQQNTNQENQQQQQEQENQ